MSKIGGRGAGRGVDSGSGRAGEREVGKRSLKGRHERGELRRVKEAQIDAVAAQPCHHAIR